VRYFELYETDSVSLGIYNPSADQSVRNITSTRNPPITLKLLNRLKGIRNRRRRERENKLDFYPVIYGDKQVAEDGFELQLRELEQVKDEIALEIEKAEIAEKDMEHIKGMAQNAIRQADLSSSTR